VVEHIRAQMNLEAEREHELLEEIRGHLEDAVADARARGLDDEEALAAAAARFGVDEVGQELQATHQGWGVLEGIAAAALPVLFALLLRWVSSTPREPLRVGSRWSAARPSGSSPLSPSCCQRSAFRGAATRWSRGPSSGAFP